METGEARVRAHRNRFPGRSRIKRRAEFLSVQTKGKKIQSRHLLVLFSPILSRGPRSQLSRIGVTITTKVDSRATRRNLFKRRVREIFRLHQRELRASFDIVVIARQNAPERSYKELEEELLSLLRRAGVMNG